jgi:DNA-binding response OmpR family regulator
VAEVVRSTILIIHGDGDELERLTRLFESRGFDIVTAATVFQANARLDGDREIDVVVAQWDDMHILGGEVYRWVLRRRSKLRGQFVFLGVVPPDGFDATVAGRCLLVDPDDEGELVRVTEAASRRSRQLAVAMTDLSGPVPAYSTARPPAGPRLLLVDDEPMLLRVMADWFSAVGFQVTAVDSGNAAIVELSAGRFHAIVTDWQMEDGSGEQLYGWIATHQRDQLERLLILTDARADQIRNALPGVPVFAKGQDADGLISMLQSIAGIPDPDDEDDGFGG